MLKKYLNGEWVDQIGNVTILKISKADFDLISDKDSSTLYIVIDGSTATCYIGDIPIVSGE